MSHAKLLPGDRVSFVQNGQRLRGIVADNLPLASQGGKPEIPVIRPRSKGRPRCKADGLSLEGRVRWMPREQLRKLPSK